MELLIYLSSVSANFIATFIVAVYRIDCASPYNVVGDKFFIRLKLLVCTRCTCISAFNYSVKLSAKQLILWRKITEPFLPLFSFNSANLYNLYLRFRSTLYPSESVEGENHRSLRHHHYAAKKKERRSRPTKEPKNRSPKGFPAR